MLKVAVAEFHQACRGVFLCGGQCNLRKITKIFQGGLNGYDAARVVERKFEAAIDQKFESAKANLMTKEDGLRIEVSMKTMETLMKTIEASMKTIEASMKTIEASMKAELRSAMLDQLKWTVGVMFTFSGIIIAAIKLL